MAEFGGEITGTYEALLTLPGIGPYCGAAIASIAFGQPVPAIDGNVLRAASRFFGIDTDITKPVARTDLFKQLLPAIRASKDPSAFTQGMIELGALVCTPKSPRCSECPLQKGCVAFQTDTVALLPVKKKKAPVPHYEVGIGIVWNENQHVLLGQRRETQMLGGLWEFPGGKQLEKETLEETVIRKIKISTGVQVSVGQQLQTVEHAFTHFTIRVHAFLCHLARGTLTANGYTEVKWVPPGEISTYPLPAVDKKIWERIFI